ncbi:hypothetical protein [Comamonas sp. JC664]|uniref:hypothetical protein n=1 Tax=Comamonas sp. JC664 TaxID=2801917 RepID=UPI00174B3C1F|nr:hypothetical protein [Comamonas sp. JC664]MBL0692853.1 hypothetical protein [Comamonas sp. JC664]GHG90851.1 hypothetical protein GCM10012319_51190 [Comamonas sp. KCTC 72670]
MLPPRASHLVGFITLAVLAFSGGALADNPPLTGSNYAIDVYQGPVLAPVRVTGLAGAYAPIAEGVEGLSVNTAAAAVRSLYSSKHVDYDVSLAFTFPSALRDTDFDNNGSVGFAKDEFVFAQLGGLIQWGPWGLGAVASVQSYVLGEDANGQLLNLGMTRVQLQLARNFFDEALVVGVGLRAVSLDITPAQDANNALASMFGANLEAGALWTPMYLPLRAALTLRAPVKGGLTPDGPAVADDAGNVRVAGLYLPASVRLPWEIEAGVAWQFGARPLQIPWGPDRAERFKELPRSKLLLTGSVLISGAVSNAIGFDAFLSQRVERSGRRLSISPRLGAELEPIENRLQLRAGSYLEPSRFDTVGPRLHGTVSAEVRLFQWSVFGLMSPDTSWRISGFADVSRQYLGWGFGVGTWH